MTITKKVVFAALGAVVLGGGVAWVKREAITLKVVEKIIRERMQDPLASLPDGLHVALCGTGSPFPDPQHAAPCTMVIAGKTVLQFDAGSSAPRQINRMGLSTGPIQATFLTHFHSDHIDGLGELMMTRWAQQSSNKPMLLIAPKGGESVLAGFIEAYRNDTSYRTAHHGVDTMNPEMSGAKGVFFEPTALSTVFEEAGVKVEAFAVKHPPIDPAVGYRVSYKGRTVVISGDTQPSDNLVEVSKGADLLLHEALHPELVGRLQSIAFESKRLKLAKIFQDIPNYHTTPLEVAQEAQKAGVKAVVLNHIVPPLPLPPMREIFMKGTSQAYNGPMTIGEDGDFYSLLPGETGLKTSRRWQ